MKSVRYQLMSGVCFILMFTPFFLYCSAQIAAKVCSLSDEQQTAAPKAFAPFAAMVKGEPRCNNCHGAIDPFADNTIHLGGKMGVISVNGKIDGSATQRGQCEECHDQPWMVPAPAERFTNKNSIQLCRKMKEEFGQSSTAFLGHVRNDPFSLVAFEGTRGLNDYGRMVYEERRKAPYKIEHPKFTADELISQAQAWVDAMGGKFQGDADCGCVPHHYSLSIDIQSLQDSHVADSVVHMEMSGHVEIPLKFKDDGSFEQDASWTWTQSGYTHMRRMDCTFKGALIMKFHLQGTVDQDKGMLHMVSRSTTTGGEGTSTCSNGMGGTGAYPNLSSPQSYSWDLPSLVGVDQQIPMPYQDPPNFTSSMKVRIIQTD